MRIRILPYRTGSASARAVAAALGARVIRLVNSRYSPRRSDVVVNWGSTAMHWLDMAEDHVGFRMLNCPLYVKDARDKLRTLAILSANGVRTVEWTTNPQAAETWFMGGDTVFVRNTTTGQGGAGITLLHEGVGFAQFPVAPLYTKRFRAMHECRVHVVNGNTYAQKKRRREGRVPTAVRNYANGYVYCTNNFECPAPVIEEAKRAVAALGLDFGAVDLLYTNDHEVRVLEVNTAPGIEGSTVDWYATQLREVIN